MPEDVARFTVLLEDIQTHVRVIADGYAGLTERMDRMDTRFERLEVKVDHLEIAVVMLATKVNGLETKVDGLETKVDGLETKVDGLEIKFDGLKTKVDGLETKFDGFAGETRLRLDRIEGHLALAGPPAPRKAVRPAASRRRKKPAKPN